MNGQQEQFVQGDMFYGNAHMGQGRPVGANAAAPLLLGCGLGGCLLFPLWLITLPIRLILLPFRLLGGRGHHHHPRF